MSSDFLLNFHHISIGFPTTKSSDMRCKFIVFVTYFPFLFATVTRLFSTLTRLISSVIQRLLNLKIYKLLRHSDMFSIEATNDLWKLVYSLTNDLRNCFILRRTVCGIFLFLDGLFADIILLTNSLQKLFYSSTNHRFRK